MKVFDGLLSVVGSKAEDAFVKGCEITEDNRNTYFFYLRLLSGTGRL